jgi:hypothetical protein
LERWIELARDNAGRCHPANLEGLILGKPEIAVPSGHDAAWLAVAGGHGKFGDAS